MGFADVAMLVALQTLRSFDTFYGHFQTRKLVRGFPYDCVLTNVKCLFDIILVERIMETLHF